MADWSMLPCDMLAMIALKLDQLDDLIYFSAVCRSWNHAFSVIKLIRNPNSVMPWLFLSENTTNENPDCLRKVYNPNNDKYYRLKVPETFGTRCWGSNFGWIALQTFDYQVHLFNPLTKVGITSLPSVLTMSHPDDDDYPPREVEFLGQQQCFDYFVKRLIVLKMPLPLLDHGDGGGTDLLVAAIFGGLDSLAFARPGDQSWTYVVSNAADVACLDDERIYIVCWDGQLLYCDIQGCSKLEDVKVMLTECAPGWIYYQLYEFDKCDKIYLLDLCGDIVLIKRRKQSGPEGYITLFFHVYRLDNKVNKWVEIKDIGDFTIFVGHHSSIACPTTSSVARNKYNRNCIYYTDDASSQWPELPGTAGEDEGVYKFDFAGAFAFFNFFYRGDDRTSLFCPPIYFWPSIN